MAAQRIVLTSPWKLGLFVFVLVVGTGFGLIYSYLALFQGQPDLENPEHVRLLYAVLGGVAALGLLGYLATVVSARPMDRVVRSGKSHQKVLKSLAKVHDAREVDPDDFKEISAVATALERWREDARAAQDAGLELAEAREQIASLENAIEEARQQSEDLSEPVETPAAPAPAVDSAALGAIATALRAKQREIGNFIESIGDCAADLAQRVQPGSGPVPSGGGNAAEVLAALRANGERLTQIRSTLDDLAEEANKLAITAALQISRLGDGAEEIVGTAENIRALSTRFQRTAADLRVCESDQSANAQKAAAAMQNGGAAPAPIEGLDAIVMVLDQSTEGLSEVLGQLAAPLQQLEALGEGRAPEAAVDTESSSAPATPTPPRVDPDFASAAPATGFDTPASAPAPIEDDGPKAEIYDIADLGGHELAAPGDGDEEDETVYDLNQFGAVEL